MSNSARNRKPFVSALQTIALLLVIGMLVAFAALLGGILLGTIAGAIIGVTIGRMVESRFVTVGAALTAIASGALTALAIRAMGEGTAGWAVGTVVFAVAGYVIWFLGASFFSHHYSD